MEDIERIIQELNSNEPVDDPQLLKKQNEGIKTAGDYLQKSKQTINYNISQIVDRTRSFNTYSEDDRYQVSDNRNPNAQQENLVLEQLTNNQDFLDNRRKEVENLREISAKIKDTTDFMSQKLNDQGVILDDIEGHVVETKNNVEKGKKEVEQANNISRGNRRKMLCLLAIVFLLLLGIGGIIYSLI